MYDVRVRAPREILENVLYSEEKVLSLIWSAQIYTILDKLKRNEFQVVLTTIENEFLSTAHSRIEKLLSEFEVWEEESVLWIVHQHYEKEEENDI